LNEMKPRYKKRLKKYLWFMEDIDFEKDKEVIITEEKFKKAIINLTPEFK